MKILIFLLLSLISCSPQGKTTGSFIKGRQTIDSLSAEAIMIDDSTTLFSGGRIPADSSTPKQ